MLTSTSSGLRHASIASSARDRSRSVIGQSSRDSFSDWGTYNDDIHSATGRRGTWPPSARQQETADWLIRREFKSDSRENDTIILQHYVLAVNEVCSLNRVGSVLVVFAENEQRWIQRVRSGRHRRQRNYTIIKQCKYSYGITSLTAMAFDSYDILL